MTAFTELGQVRLSVAAAAQVIGSAAGVMLQPGALGTVVMVHSAATQCQMYDLECQLPDGRWALATVPEANLIKA